MARDRDKRRSTKKDEEAKRLLPEDLAFLGEAARRQIEEQLTKAESAEPKTQDQVLVVDQAKKSVKRVKAGDLGKMTLRDIAKSLGYPSVGGVSKLLEALVSGAPVSTQAGINRELKQQQASLQAMTEQVDGNTKLLAMMGDEQKRTNDLLATLLDEIKNMKGGGGPNIPPVPNVHTGKEGAPKPRPGAGPAQVPAGKGGFGTTVLKWLGIGAVAGGTAAAAQQMFSGGDQTPTTGSSATQAASPPAAIGSPITGKTGSDESVRNFLQAGGVTLDPRRDNWCAAFVNSTLKQSGIPGTGSMVANSFQNWGTEVKPTEVRKGDVVIETRGKGPGQVGGHVGIATGNVRDGKIEMIAGNSGQSSDPGQNAVMTYYVPINDQLMIRRSVANREQAETALTTAQQIAGPANQQSVQQAPLQQQEMVQQPVTSGLAAAAASLNADVARRQPPELTVVDSTTESGSENSTLGSQQDFNDPSDPGPVEPDDARERYEKLFAEAA